MLHTGPLRQPKQTVFCELIRVSTPDYEHSPSFAKSSWLVKATFKVEKDANPDTCTKKSWAGSLFQVNMLNMLNTGGGL